VCRRRKPRKTAVACRAARFLLTGNYASASPSTEQQANHVAAVHTLNAAGRKAAEKAGRTPLAFHELTADANTTLVRRPCSLLPGAKLDDGSFA
jgi:hypothetical protein